jgi:hypothetical protein
MRWAPTSETLAGDPLTVTGYEMIVTRVDHDDPPGRSRPVFDVQSDEDSVVVGTD